MNTPTTIVKGRGTDNKFTDFGVLLVFGGGKGLLQQAMQVAIGGDDVTAFHHCVATTDVGDKPTGFADQDDSGGDIPGLQTDFPKPFEAPGGDIGQIQGGGTEPAYTC